MIPLNQKDGRTYHLINKQNKCISASIKLNNKVDIGAVQSKCNATETRQLWKWSGNSLCSNFGCISTFNWVGPLYKVLILKPEKK